MADHSDCSACSGDDQLTCLWNKFQEDVRALLDETLGESDAIDVDDSTIELQERAEKFPVELAEGLLRLSAEIYRSEDVRASEAIYELSACFEELEMEEESRDSEPPPPPSNPGSPLN